MIANNGCPCPGIGDAALGITDTVLHFYYNALTYVALLAPFWYVWRGGLTGSGTPAYAGK